MSLRENIVSEILDRGLARSTWRDKFPRAYEDLLLYREDMEGSVNEAMPNISTKVIVVIPHYWAKGDTVSEAWENLRGIAGGTTREHRRGNWQLLVCYDTDDVKTRLDEFGFNWSYPTGHKPVLIEEHVKKS